jgi:acyl-CoA synthetase (AMP-forming)/AMP-acid ligase II
MGLIGFHVGPMLIGSTVSSMSPLTFIHSPLIWLRILSRYKRVITGAPPFALELCATKATPEDLRSLDLTRVEALLVGAEPVRYSALTQFASVFASCGFNDHVRLDWIIALMMISHPYIVIPI